LAAIFEKPERTNIAWRDIEALFSALVPTFPKEAVQEFAWLSIKCEQFSTVPTREKKPVKR
jgi:hypothetical protein